MTRLTDAEVNKARDKRLIAYAQRIDDLELLLREANVKLTAAGVGRKLRDGYA